MRTSVMLLMLVAGCGSRVSLGDNGSGKDGLGGTPEDAGTSADSRPAWLDVDVGGATPPSDTGGSPGPTDAATPGPDAWTGEYVEVEEVTGGRAQKIRVTADCRVTDHTGLDAMGNSARCSELFAVITDPTTYSCGPIGGVGTVTVRFKDGSVFVRDLSADRCAVKVPSLLTHKATWAVWYSAGGGGK